MTVQDLLRHTSGLTYGNRGTSLINAAYVDAKIGDRSTTNEEMVHRSPTVPLLFKPGERWEYSVAVDVQGRLIEVLTGKKLGEALAERVLQPLGMVDTGFQVPAAKVARAAQPGQQPNGQPMTPRFKVDDGAKYESGGGGMLSTIEDYLRFTMALANGGAFQGKRIIGKQTLDFMTADHTGNRPGRPPAWASASASRSARGWAIRRSRARSANMAGPATPARPSGSTPRNSSSPSTWCR